MFVEVRQENSTVDGWFIAACRLPFVELSLDVKRKNWFIVWMMADSHAAPFHGTLPCSGVGMLAVSVRFHVILRIWGQTQELRMLSFLFFISGS